MDINNKVHKARIDHLVVAANSLEEGVRWCKNTLGITPEPGGSHALFGTHNQLIRLQSAAHALAYLEIIAIDPSAKPTRASHLRRWFDLDALSLQQQLQQEGPQLIHWVASVPKLATAIVNLRALGIDRGSVIEASRPTAQGLLQWKISVRDDGQRLFGGTLPTLIEWGDEHPAQSLPEPALELRSFSLQHPQAQHLQLALNTIGLGGVPVTVGPAGMAADFILGDGSSLCLSHLESV